MIFFCRQRCEYRKCEVKNKKVHEQNLKDFNRIIKKSVTEKYEQESEVETLGTPQIPLHFELGVSETSTTQQASKEHSQRASIEPLQQASKEPTQQASKEPTQQASKEPTQQASTEPSQQANMEPRLQTCREPTPPTSKEPTQQTSKKTTKLYSCPKCGKNFSKKPYADVHCKPKPSWKCEQCGIEINQACNVKRHERRCSKSKKPNIKDQKRRKQ
jgi:hypothetical protein